MRLFMKMFNPLYVPGARVKLLQKNKNLSNFCQTPFFFSFNNFNHHYSDTSVRTETEIWGQI